MFSDDDRDRRQLNDLAASEPRAPDALLLPELAGTAAARQREMVGELVDLLLGQQLAPRASSAMLARLAGRCALARRRLLGLRARLGAALLRRLGWISRGAPPSYCPSPDA